MPGGNSNEDEKRLKFGAASATECKRKGVDKVVNGMNTKWYPVRTDTSLKGRAKNGGFA
jgi:hypothetical protein